MTFNYAAFRAEFVRRKREQRLRRNEEDRRRANLEAVVRPTEFAASLRVAAAESRLTLTELEKRVSYYDRRYLRQTRAVQSDYVTLKRARYIASMAGCLPSNVPQILMRIEWVHWRCELLGIPLDEAYTPRPGCYKRHQRTSRWRVRVRE